MPELDESDPGLLRLAARYPILGVHIVAAAARLSGDTTTKFQGAPEYLA